MRTLSIFARRVWNGLLSWAVVGAVWLMFGLLFFGVGRLIPEDSKIWLAVLIAGAPLAAAVMLRLAMIGRPWLAGWLTERFLLNLPGFNESPTVPERFEVTPTTNPGFRHPEAIRGTVERLAARGFVDVGTFDFTLEQTVPTVLLAHPGSSVWATLFEAEWSRPNIEFVTRYADGSRVGFSNGPDRGMEPRPNSVVVRQTGADPVALFDRCLTERPAGDIVPVTPDTTVEAFRADSEEFLAWRREHGFSRRERGMMFAPLMRIGLTVLIVGFAYLTVLAVLAGLGVVALADKNGPGALLVVPTVVGGALLPVLLIFPALRWMGGGKKRPGGCGSDRAGQPTAGDAAAGPFRLKREANLDSMFDDGPFDRPLRSFGFDRVGTYYSPAGFVSLSVRPDDGLYAAVWCPEMRPWLEIVAAGADGSHRRVTPVSAPDAEGRVTVDWAAGVAELESRCAAGTGGMPRAALTARNVAAEMERHLEADPGWRKQLFAAAAESRRHRPSPWRLFVSALLFSPWLLVTLLYLGLLAAETWFGWQHEYINSDRASGLLILTVLGYLVVWPWLRDQYAASRKQAEEEETAAGSRSV